MIELMTGLPADVVGFVAKGEVTAFVDYRDILDPAVRAVRWHATSASASCMCWETSSPWPQRRRPVG